MDYRSSSDYEQHGKYVPWVKENPSTAIPVSSKSQMITNSSNASELHSIPTVLTVSPSGERITTALESLETSFGDTNPFLDSVSNADIPMSDDDFLPKLPTKHEKFRQQNRRRAQARDRKKANKIILTKNLLPISARRPPKCAAVQTDALMGVINFPENIGDGRRFSQSYMDLTSSTAIETISRESLTSTQYLSESQRKFLSFLLMVILIFWITSIVLEVEIPAEFCRIALNYFWYFKSGFYQQEIPLTFTEKCWEYIKNMLKFY